MNKKDYVKLMQKEGFTDSFIEQFWQEKPVYVDLRETSVEVFRVALAVVGPDMKKTEKLLEEELAKLN